jgi:hypothetical protein
MDDPPVPEVDVVDDPPVLLDSPVAAPPVPLVEEAFPFPPHVLAARPDAARARMMPRETSGREA